MRLSLCLSVCLSVCLYVFPLSYMGYVPKIKRNFESYCTVVAYFYVMLLMFFLDNFKSDCVLRTMFLSKSDAVQSVWQAFENYVTV